jgi:hypothetical protein
MPKKSELLSYSRASFNLSFDKALLGSVTVSMIDSIASFISPFLLEISL